MASMLNIQVAVEEDFQPVMDFYYELIDGIDPGDTGTVGWIKGVYPHPDYVKASIAASQMYVGRVGEQIVTAMVVNQSGNESYQGYDWPLPLKDEELVVIHALGVHPAFLRQGYAGKMVHFVQDYVERMKLKAIRLDVLHGNEAAMNLYRKMGFTYHHTLPMFYEDTGWTDFLLYEWVNESALAGEKRDL